MLIPAPSNLGHPGLPSSSSGCRCRRRSTPEPPPSPRGAHQHLRQFAIVENVIAGNALSRRLVLSVRCLLDLDPDAVLHLRYRPRLRPASATISFISPTDRITETCTSRAPSPCWTFVFLYAPDTVAPEEMHIWIPELQALTCAENANHSPAQHPDAARARTRDARDFARYLDETLERWGDDAAVHYGPHTWPVWGNENLVDVHRVAARHLQVHPRPGPAPRQQGLHTARGGRGHRAARGARAPLVQPRLPRHAAPRRARRCSPRSSGMWDGDPVSLHPHTPVDSAHPLRRPHRCRAILAEGQRAFDEGDYRWAVVDPAQARSSPTLTHERRRAAPEVPGPTSTNPP